MTSEQDGYEYPLFFKLRNTSNGIQQDVTAIDIALDNN